MDCSLAAAAIILAVVAIGVVAVVAIGVAALVAIVVAALVAIAVVVAAVALVADTLDCDIASCAFAADTSEGEGALDEVGVDEELDTDRESAGSRTSARNT